MLTFPTPPALNTLYQTVTFPSRNIWDAKKGRVLYDGGPYHIPLGAEEKNVERCLRG